MALTPSSALSQAYDANLDNFVDTFTFPTVDGTANQVLATDGSGTLSFATDAAGSWEKLGTYTITNGATTLRIPSIFDTTIYSSFVVTVINPTLQSPNTRDIFFRLTANDGSSYVDSTSGSQVFENNASAQAVANSAVALTYADDPALLTYGYWIVTVAAPAGGKTTASFIGNYEGLTYGRASATGGGSFNISTITGFSLELDSPAIFSGGSVIVYGVK